jgi:hypothetical protein
VRLRLEDQQAPLDKVAASEEGQGGGYQFQSA